MYIKKRNIIIGIILIVVLSIGLSTAVFQLTPKALGTEASFEKLHEVYKLLDNQYVEEVDKEKLVEGAIQGMVKSLDDPYTTYMDIDEAKGFQEAISSSFEGIGAEVTEQNGKIMIVSPIKGSPAEKAGLKPEDKILKVDGESIEGMSANEAVMLIRGEKGSEVKLTIEREGIGTMDVAIIRDTIPLHTVYSEMTDEKIGTIQITRFSENTGQELADALMEFDKEKVKGIVLDLRQNPGGLMDQAIAMTDMFVDKGKTILQVKDNDGNVETYKAENRAMVDVPVVVITDNGTASAAEIMAAALHESANIPVVGETTFGKGTVQNAQEFNDGTSIKYTIAKWLTPSGQWIHEKGLQPQHEVSLPEYANISYLDPKVSIKQGDSSTDVKTAEEMLIAVGYEVNADGFLDEKEANKVQSFQQDHGLNKTGIITGETTTTLMNLVREKIVENDTQMKKAIDVLKEEMAS
ncbi:S41 family peptidase [Bacillus sp. FJAT-47783]|uniref:S41 family peptidase n=1 Tax=Bacillus sp. FJAT-47783 TaxID=2922712 RepID=UPI001FAD65FC|nr:S41 family peptidase [Bacillus sp. FJAT-47783]